MGFSTQADVDLVTRLPLYNYFIDKVRFVLNESYQGEKYVLVSTDITNFKYINHLYGYEKSNDLLQSVADILTDQEELNVVTCRTHSDHFISMFKYTDKEDFVTQIEECSKRFVAINAKLYKSVSLHLNNGLYFLNGLDEDILYSIDKANVARRSIKGKYLLNMATFSEEMLCRKENDAKIIALFDSALRAGRVQVYFQPKVDIVTHRISGAEALSRIIDENGKLLPPIDFVPILENTGKIVELDKYVMTQVFKSIRDWVDRGRTPVPISINLSRMHFYEKNVADNIYKEFKKHNIPAKYVEFELTESLFFDESEVIVKQVEQLRKYGFKVSMDDFGVGYSNLNALGILPVDIIKFDRGFVKNSISSESGYQIMYSLIKVLKRINYSVICEGIETRSDEKMIFECGCDNAQGFLYDRPIPLNVFEDKYIF